jgi:hypothetical protein
MNQSVTKAIILSACASLFACGGGGGPDPATTPVSYPYQVVYAGECKNDPMPATCTFELGFNAGYQAGYDEGFNEGEDYGYDDGYYYGHNDGYTEGYDDGYDDGYSDALNSGDSDNATDTNFSGGASEANKLMVKRAANRLHEEYGLPQDKALAVASALNVWAVAVERGFTTPRDINDTFVAVFGVKLSDAITALKSFSKGDTAGMKDITNRSASALGIKPHQAKKFIKGMYRQALTDAGYDAESIDW